MDLLCFRIIVLNYFIFFYNFRDHTEPTPSTEVQKSRELLKKLNKETKPEGWCH